MQFFIVLKLSNLLLYTHIEYSLLDRNLSIRLISPCIKSLITKVLTYSFHHSENCLLLSIFYRNRYGITVSLDEFRFYRILYLLYISIRIMSIPQWMPCLYRKSSDSRSQFYSCFFFAKKKLQKTTFFYDLCLY